MSADANEFVPTAPISDIDFEPVQSSGIIEPEPYIQTETHEPFIQLEQPLISTNEADSFTLKMDQLSLTENIPTTEQKSEFEALIAQSVESVPQPEQVVESSVSEPIVAAAAVAATTAAVAAAAVGVAKATAASPKTKTTTDTKKTDVKGKVAPIKRPTAATITSKLAAKPSTTTATKTTVAPRVASRTLAPKVGEKKTTTTSTITRKPLSNGSK